MIPRNAREDVREMKKDLYIFKDIFVLTFKNISNIIRA